MTLNAPRQLYFIIAVVIALIAVISVFAAPGIPAFWLMTVAFVILALACVIKGL